MLVGCITYHDIFGKLRTTRLLYRMATKTQDPPEYLQEQHYRGGMINQDPPEKARGWIVAVDVSTGDVSWRYAADSPMLANITATASDLVFTGTTHGDFLVLDAGTGNVLYDHPMGKSVAGGVLTYAIDGKQCAAGFLRRALVLHPTKECWDVGNLP